MTARSRLLMQLAAGLACAPAWAQVDMLKHDPFTRPAYTKVAPPGASTQAGGSAGKEAVRESAWEPDLAAVLVAGPKSAVSIDGTLVRIGEVVQGHRLIEVHEREAVFVRNRKRVTVSLRPLVAHGAPAGESAAVARPQPLRTQDALREREEK